MGSPQCGWKNFGNSAREKPLKKPFKSGIKKNKTKNLEIIKPPFFNWIRTFCKFLTPVGTNQSLANKKVALSFRLPYKWFSYSYFPSLLSRFSLAFPLKREFTFNIFIFLDKYMTWSNAILLVFEAPFRNSNIQKKNK